MREIKFRAWDKKYGMGKPFTLEDAVEEQEGIYFTPDKIYMQFTGLKDKNGKEIYFDDIVKFTFKDREDFYSGTAVITRTMNEGAGILYDFKDNEPSNVFAVIEGGQIEEVWQDENLWDLEVIGNIYENPELLKGGEKYE